MNLQPGLGRIAILWGNIQWHNRFSSVDRQTFDSSTSLQQTWLHLFATADQSNKLALKGMLILKRFSRIRKLELNHASSLISHQTNLDVEIDIWLGGINQTRCINFFIPEPLGDDFFVQFPEVSVLRQDEFWCIKAHLVSSSKRWNVTPSHYGLHTGAVKLPGNGQCWWTKLIRPGFEPFRRFFSLNWLFFLWKFSLRKENHLVVYSQIIQ